MNLTQTPRPVVSRALASVAAALALVAVAATASLAAKGDCGQPVSTGTGPTSSDCLFVLKAGVGNVVCEDCVCDVNNSSSQTASDALLCLKKAVGQPVSITCPACAGGTTTTTTLTVDKPSTTSTSTTSTTTTIPVHCESASDCSALGDPFRCNPNIGTCEKPCNKNTDCKDFYECNTGTHYCQAPALLY